MRGEVDFLEMSTPNHVYTVDLFCVGKFHSKSLREPFGILATWAIPVTWATAVAFLPSQSPSRWQHLWEALVAQATPAAWGPYLTGERWRIFDPYKTHFTLKISQIMAEITVILRWHRVQEAVKKKTPGRKTTLGLLAAHCCRSEYMTFHFIYHLPLIIIIVMMSCV